MLSMISFTGGLSTLPFAEGYHCRNEEMGGACLVQTLHRVPPVSHDTGLLTWDPSQTYHLSTE